MSKKIGHFTSDGKRDAFLRAYQELERLWPIPSSTTDVVTSYGPTHVRISGEGSGLPLVLVHGLSGNGLSWHTFARELSQGRVVYAPDNIGAAGRSIQTAPIESAADIGAWGEQLLDGLGLERAHLFGYSEGAWYASLIASRFGSSGSKRIASLTLGEGITTLVKPSSAALRKILAVGMFPTQKRMAAFNEWLSPGTTLTPAEIACATATLAYRRYSPWPTPLTDPELAAIDAPTLAFFGSETRVGDPAAAGHRITDNVPGGSVTIIPGGGHGVLWQMPELVLPRILQFLVEND